MSGSRAGTAIDADEFLKDASGLVDSLYDVAKSLFAVRYQSPPTVQQLELLQSALNDLVKSETLRLIDAFGKKDGVEITRLGPLRRTRSATDHDCSYCAEAVDCILYTDADGEGATVTTEICPRCGVLSYRSEGDLRVTIHDGDLVCSEGAEAASLSVLVSNHTGQPLHGFMAVSFFPPLPDQPVAAGCAPIEFSVDGGGAQVAFSVPIVVSDQVPNNFYIVQVACAVELGLNYYFRPVRLRRGTHASDDI